MDTNSLEQSLGTSDYPWLIFELEDAYYAISSRKISGIMQLPNDLVAMPNAPAYTRGIFLLRGEVVPLNDLRAIFGMPSVAQEYQDFIDMIDARKQDHLHWVGELKRCVTSGEPFTLAKDPHKCAFGRWYDSYTPSMQSIAFHLRKIEEPHRKLHEAAREVERCSRDCATCSHEECLKDVFSRLEEEYVPRILSLLDETKELFRHHFREMAIVLEAGEHSVGIIVDEVISVEKLQATTTEASQHVFAASAYIKGVSQNNSIHQNVMLVDDDTIISFLTDQIAV